MASVDVVPDSQALPQDLMEEDQQLLNLAELAAANSTGEQQEQQQQQQPQPQQQDTNKRQRQSEILSEGAGPSGATQTSSSAYLESRSEALLLLEKAVSAQVQPAVSFIVKRHQQFIKLERDTTWMQQTKEEGKMPKFIRDHVLDFEPTFIVTDFNNSTAYQAARSKLRDVKAAYLQATFDIVLELKIAEKQQAEALKAAVASEAQIMLQQPFSTIPASWITKPEVQRASREQQEDFEFNLMKALSNVDRETQQKAKKQSQQAAAAEASEVEAAAVTVEQQVKQAAKAMLKSQQQEIKQLQKQVVRLQKQAATAAPAANKAAAAATKTKPAAATKPAGNKSSHAGSRSHSRGRSKERSQSRQRNSSKQRNGRSPSVSFADAVKGKGKAKQQSHQKSKRDAADQRSTA